MTTIYYDADASLGALSNLTIGLIGYGNQGRAHALNLRDSGISVCVGSRPDSAARTRASSDGFAEKTISDVAQNCQALALMLPDEALPKVYAEQIEPYLRPRTAFFFAHGFTVRHRTVKLPADADIILVAPTGPGRQLRTLYQSGHGLPGLLAVEQDVSGQAWQRCLAYAKGIGCTRAGVIKTTFEEETVTDLFCEQAVLCGGIPELIKASFDTLVAAGYQKELAYISCLKEVKLISDLLFASGIDGMRSAISNTAKFGSIVSGPRLINASTKHELREILHDIESGAFAKRFIDDSAEGSPILRDFTAREKNGNLAKTGRELKDTLAF